MIFLQRELILRELSFAQLVLGTIASAAVPVLTLLLLLTVGRQPLARLGFALAMACHDGRWRGRDPGGV